MVIKYEGYSNCYVVSNRDKAILIDCGLEKWMIDDINKKYQIEAILLTHGHYDHIDGLRYFKDKTIYIHELEEEFLYNSSFNLYYFMDKESYNKGELDIKLVHDGDVLDLIGLKIKVIHTPGHTRGSVCYLIDNDLFTGDTLFNLSVGRTDFPTGDFLTLRDSLYKLKMLGHDYHVYPGHDNDTSLLFEIENNRYFGA